MPNYIEKDMTTALNGATVIIFAANGSLTKDGRNVMGKGLGKVLSNMLKGIDTALGNYIKEGGNKCYSFKVMKYTFISFPTKNNYWEEEDVALIKKSVSQLKKILDDMETTDKKIIMEYPLLSKEMRDDVLKALKSLDIDIYVK